MPNTTDSSFLAIAAARVPLTNPRGNELNETLYAESNFLAIVATVVTTMAKLGN